MTFVRKTLAIAAAAAMLVMAACGGEEPAEETVDTVQEETGTVTGEETSRTPEEEGPETTAGDGDSASEAIPMTEELVEGALEDEDDENWYTIQVQGGGILNLIFSPGADAERLNFLVLDSELAELEQEWDVRPPSNRTFRYVTPDGEERTFYVTITGGSAGSYTIQPEVTMQNDAGSGRDAGGSAVSALELESDEEVTGLLGDLDQSDWYVFDLEAGSILDISMAPGNEAENINAALYGTDLETEWQEWDVNPGVTRSYTLQLGQDDAGRYYAEVSIGGYGTYTLNVETSSQNDAGSGGDAGDRPVTALPADTLDVIQGRVAGYDEDDFYSIELEENEPFSFAFTPDDDAGQLNVQVLDPEQNGIWQEWSVSAGVTREFTCSEEHPAGMYYVNVSRADDGSYSIEME